MILLFSHRSSVIKPSQPMRAVGREPAKGGIPVELSSYQPLDKIHKYFFKTWRLAMDLYKVQENTYTTVIDGSIVTLKFTKEPNEVLVKNIKECLLNSIVKLSK